MFGWLWWTMKWQGFERKRSLADVGICLEGLTKTTKPAYRLRFRTEYKKLPTIHPLCSRQFQLSALVGKLCFTDGEGSVGIPRHGLGHRGTPVWFQTRVKCFYSSNLPGWPWGPPSEYRQLFTSAHGGRGMKVNTRLHQRRHSECPELHLHLP